jgi:hypothetical protein
MPQLLSRRAPHSMQKKMTRPALSCDEELTDKESASRLKIIISIVVDS